MIYCFFVWAFLTLISGSIGLALLSWLASEGFGRLSDRAIAAVWLGVILLAVTLQAVSLFSPLSPLVGLAVMLFLGTLAIALPSTRLALVALCQKMTGVALMGGLVLILAMALLTVQTVTWVESTFYHYTAIRWLSEFGTVPGLVLILPNLGITSTWFALNAPLNGGAIAFRAGSLLNGFILTLALVHCLICLSRWKSGQARLSDRFSVSFWLLFLAYVVVSKEMRLIIVSASPDLPVALLVEAVSWSILVLSESAPPRSQLKSALIPLILAVGAVTIKLSALPLLVVASLFYLFNSRFFWLKLLLAGIVLTIVLLPSILTGYTTSGCPLYPSALFCLNVPWSRTIEEVQQFADKTQDIASWYGEPPAGQNLYLWVFWQWFKGRTLHQIMAFLVVLSAACSIYLGLTFNYKRHSGKIWLLALGILGIAFIILKGPLIRFGIGYLLLLPALAIGVASEIHLPSILSTLEEKLKNWHRPLKLAKKASQGNFLGTVTLALVGIILVKTHLQGYWLLPPKLRAPVIRQQQVNGINYFIPGEKQGGCSASPLPCTIKLSTNVELKDPILGLKGGFIRTDY